MTYFLNKDADLLLKRLLFNMNVEYSNLVFVFYWTSISDLASTHIMLPSSADDGSLEPKHYNIDWLSD